MRRFAETMLINSQDFPHSDVRHHFQVLLAIDRLQPKATVYSVARELGYTRWRVQIALRVAAQQFGCLFEARGATYKLVDWGVLNKSALIAFVGNASSNNINAKQDPRDGNDEANSVTGISRVDDDVRSSYGWHATLDRTSGKCDQFFSDVAYGGKEAALLATKQWYDQKVLECPLMPRIARVSIIRTNNRSGMAGVYRWPADGRVDRKAYWAARWVETVGAKPVTKKFSIKRYGEDAAKRMAIAARENALAGLID